jgi:outer membrane receptor protein involved in Fe transport
VNYITKLNYALFFLSFCFLQAQPSSEQRLGLITGTVIDAILNQPIPYVTVLVKDNEDNTLLGGITDEKGNFKLESVPVGTHTLRVQYIGYQAITRNISIGENAYRVDIGKILLKETSTELDEVEVIAEVSTIEQKVDRKVITIGKDLAAVGTASELLVGIPSINVDPQSGAISLRGNENVPVMVDGKLSNIPAAQLLKQIPSSAIKSVELITNPSAKYNPDGMSGIINIVLHKNQFTGFNGSLNTNWSKEINSKFNSGLNLNYRTGKFNIYGNYSNNISENANHGHIDRTQDLSEQFFNFNDDRESHIVKLGLDVYVNDKNTLSMFTSLNPADDGTLGTTKTFFQKDPSLNDYQIFDANGNNHSAQYNVNYKHDFAKEGSNIELEVDHNIFDSNNPVSFRFPDEIPKNYDDKNNTDRKRTTVNLDYVNPLTENSKLELGAEARLFDTNILFSSNQKTEIEGGKLLTYRDVDFDYTRNIYSLYATYGKKLNKWTYQVGVRAENVNVDAIYDEDATVNNKKEKTNSTFLNNYTQLYPSMFVTYSPSEKNSYQLSYSRRIDRPGIGQVNPIKEWSTPLVSSYGNQELLPQFTNSIEANYTRRLKNGTITGGVFYRIISDEINRALYVDKSDVKSGKVILTHDNFNNTSAFGVELSSNYKPTKWWSLNGSFDLFSQTQEGIAEYVRVPLERATVNDIIRDSNVVDNIAWNFRMFNSFSASKKLTFTAFLFYRGKNKNLQFDMLPMYFMNLGGRLSVLKGKGTINFGFNDVFDTMRFRFGARKPFPSEGEFNWESRTVQLGFNYRFGSGKYRAKSRRQRDNDEKSGGGGMF